MNRTEALAKYLGVEPETIKDGYSDNIFETEDGEEYLVVTEDEGYNLAKEEVVSFIDDLGIGGFTPSFQEWVYTNAIDEDFINDVMEEEIEYLRSDLEDEEGAENLENLDLSDRIEYLKDLLGESEFSKMVAKNNAIDYDTVAEEAISWDGVGHFIALYDGKEIELEDDLYAYRVG